MRINVFDDHGFWQFNYATVFPIFFSALVSATGIEASSREKKERTVALKHS